MSEYIPTILLALFGFIALAVILLAPVYRFLKREERAGDEWTRALRAQHDPDQPPSANGTPTPDSEQRPHHP